jgi:hypothetical protein
MLSNIFSPCSFLNERKIKFRTLAKEHVRL